MYLFACLIKPNRPPGTGKTFTACALISTIAILRHDRLKAGGDISKGQKNHRILACAHSNVATDNLLDGILKLGMANVVRLGRPANVQSYLWNYTMDALLQKETDWIFAKQRLDDSLEDLYALTGSKSRGSFDEDDEIKYIKERVANSKKRLEKVEDRCIMEILNSADCVVSTCIGSGIDTLKEFTKEKGVHFKTGWFYFYG